MAFKSSNPVGRRVRLKIPVSVMAGTFEARTEMTITDSGPMGLNLIDDQGNRLLDTGIMGDNFFEFID